MSEELKAQLLRLGRDLYSARLVLGTYAIQRSWKKLDAIGEYACTIPLPWQMAAMELGLSVDKAPTDLEVVLAIARLSGS